MYQDTSDQPIYVGTFRLQCPDVEPIVEKAINMGYKLIDTAGVYRNETNIGKVLKKLSLDCDQRDNIFITSKLSPTDQGMDKAKKAAMASLNSLQLSYLDMYLIHWPGTAGFSSESSRNAELRKESWLELEKLYLEGKFKAIGISNYTVQHIQELLQYCTVLPSLLQVEVHPYLIQKELREFCKEHNIHVQAYSSFGSQSGCKELFSHPAVVQIAKENNKSPAQILLRWAIQHGMSVIPKTANVERLKENMEIFDFSLTQAQVQMLDNLDQGKHYCWDPTGIS